ncbi:RNA polymerase sigma factor [Frigoribacterium sp. MEB024]|uniref:RNA polymerase sigma factor n=1 Tax=Frigoribacterium sp. MEB024 TaxID=1589899 RepID=UPI0005BDF8B2|nr:sigma-70 family RNA polymerase sigma factor [Frigoribacterium sp. MEB024]KIU03717.1 RNA polymerase sigma 70 [Frigoribacterium sp. MEB024]
MAADLTEATDAVLASRAAEGDERAFEVLLRRHLGLMTAYATRLTGSRADATDAVQEASITIWRELPTLQTPAAVKGWMMRIVSRKAFDLIRSRRLTDDVDDLELPAATPTTDPERRASSNDAMEALRAALARLPASQRRVWALREVGGESYTEIAERTGTTVTAVRGQLARARETLTREMEAWR